MQWSWFLYFKRIQSDLARWWGYNSFWSWHGFCGAFDFTITITITITILSNDCTSTRAESAVLWWHRLCHPRSTTSTKWLHIQTVVWTIQSHSCFNSTHYYSGCDCRDLCVLWVQIQSRERYFSHLRPIITTITISISGRISISISIAIPPISLLIGKRTHTHIHWWRFYLWQMRFWRTDASCLAMLGPDETLNMQQGYNRWLTKDTMQHFNLRHWLQIGPSDHIQRLWNPWRNPRNLELCLHDLKMETTLDIVGDGCCILDCLGW